MIFRLIFNSSRDIKDRLIECEDKIYTKSAKLNIEQKCVCVELYNDNYAY